jgi:hypothetical protein
MAFSPIAFVGANAKDRLAFLLQAMPIEFRVEQLAEVLGERAPARSLDLDDFNAFLEGLIERRTEVNRAVKQYDGSISELEKALPEDEDRDWGEELSILQRQISVEEQAVAAASGDRDAWIEGQKSEKTQDYQGKIRDLEKQIQTLQTARIEALNEIKEEGQRLYEEAVSETRKKITGLKEQAATAAQKADEATRAGVIKNELAKSRQKAQVQQTESDQLTLCIDKLRGLKKTILDNLPIDGVDIREGDVYVDDTPWDQVNTSDQHIVAAQVSALKDDRLPFRIIDDAEHLDEERMEALGQGYREAGFQVVLACKTTYSDLTVETIP